MITYLRKTHLLLPALFLLIAMSCSRGPLDEVTADNVPSPAISSATYQYSSQFGNGVNAADFTVLDDGSGLVFVFAQIRPSTSGDVFRFASPHIVFQPWGWTVPNDGQTYWAVPFDPSDTPTKMMHGGQQHVSCNCTSSPLGPGGGSCELIVGGSSASCVAVSPNPCQAGCSIQVLSNQGGWNLAGGASVLIRANSININGITYQ